MALFSAATILPAAFGISYTGPATHCSSLAVCTYSITEGLASVAGGISGYVGQNFTFSRGSVSFKLPGETTASNDAGVYNGRAIDTKVFSSVYGIIYKVDGTFAAPDSNNEKIVKGVTHGFVGIKGHSGRGGGIYFTLVNGSIALTPANVDVTAISVSCNPSSFFYPVDTGSSTKCTATVHDLANSTSKATGRVSFTSNGGTFMPVWCKLLSGSCSVKFTPSIAESGAYTFTISGTYKGDLTHYHSSNSTSIYVTAN